MEVGVGGFDTIQAALDSLAESLAPLKPAKPAKTRVQKLLTEDVLAPSKKKAVKKVATKKTAKKKVAKKG